MRWFQSSLFRSASVGVVATLVDISCLALLIGALRLDPVAANLPALLAGIAVQFIGNKWFAFENREQAWFQQGLGFAAIELGALALSAAGFHVLVTATAISFVVARLTVSFVVYFAYSYPLWRWLFRPAAGARN